MNKDQFVENQQNPYAAYEPAFDVLDLPSQGMFYPKVDGKPVNTVTVTHLTAQDEGIMSSPNLINSGRMIDALLERKVKCKIPIDDLLVGDRLAILVYLRATMERFYHVKLVDPDTGKSFEHEIDLAALKMNDIKYLPNQEGFFDFILPKSKRRVTFRLMTGGVEKNIRMRNQSEQKLRKTEEDYFDSFKLEELVVSIEGIDDKLGQTYFLKNMPIMDARRLHSYITDVTPTINLEVDVPTPSGGRFRLPIPITREFLYPTI